MAGAVRSFACGDMDTFAVTVNPDGSLSIDTGKITLGGTDDPQRAVLP